MDETQVKVTVNGKEAEDELKRLRERADELKKSMLEAYRAGNNEAAKAFKKELRDTEQQLRKNESGVKAVERTLRQLNKATPKDLNNALKHLQNELKTIERGTPAWDAHVAKIRTVKAEIDKVNAELKQSESLLVRMKNRVNDWGAMAAGGIAALTGVVAAGKAAVSTYAEMQQEEANVRKYTGMTEEQVNHLNDAFKKMDTRSSREQLNQLAQEAGRLGLQSEEDVLGFVKAADKINVALDDLGDGATLTLSKLTDIFGDKQRLGVEQSLLSVGSVINELSQNSTASAPYLAEFAQRLAGVGAQAHMTIPEIMGFGAVLDSQGQKLEMSSTALSKVIMNMFKDPAKIAEATGLSIEKFSETCKRSTNEGLLMLLERLNELGGIDSLAPVFKDMGENGARASAVLAALAGNVDMVRQQQEAANEAFNQAISIDKEFTVQNTTVQAELEKRKKIFQEHAIELGQKLLPVMGYFHSSMSMTMKVLSATIDFVKKYRTELLAAAAAVATYYAIVKAQDAWNAFVGGCKKAIDAVKAFNKALMSNPWAAAAALVVGLTIAVAGWIKKSREAARAADEHRKALERQREAEKATASAVGEVVGQYSRMKAEWEKLTTAQQKKEWLDKNRDAFEQLGLNINNAVDADEAFVRSSDKVIAALQARAKANALQNLYEKKMQEVYEGAAAMEDNARRYKAGDSADGTDAIAARRALGNDASLTETKSTYGEDYVSHYEAFTEEGARRVNEYLDQLHQQAVADAVKIGEASVSEVFGSWMSAAQTEAAKAEAETNGLVGNKPSGGATGGGGTVVPGTPDEKELKKQLDAKLKLIDDNNKAIQAQNKIDYLTGSKDFKTYTEDNLKQEILYHRERRDAYTKGSAEYLQEEAAALEAEKKLKKEQNGQSVKDEQQRYSNEKAAADQRYADGKISAKAYQLEMERLELEHLQNLVDIYDEGSEERLKAQEKYNQTSLKYQQKHAQEARKMQEQLQKEYFSSLSGISQPENYEEEKLQLAALREVMLAQATAEQKKEIERAYQEARYELAKKYNDQAEMSAVNSGRAAVDKVIAYMKTDGYQAFAQTFQTLVNGMGQIFSGLSSLIDAETDLQTAQIEKRYQAEIDAAGENEEKVAQLEAEKEKKIAAIKNEAEDKKYAMQVASTIAQTAISAVNAYSSAAAIPAVGWIMAPIAAAMAVAAGGIQLMTLKTQRDAALAQGYAAGGYTMPGSKYQPAGIVHAGEWVASQELLANPTAAATIAQLDQAQRTNTIGQLSKPAPSIAIAKDEPSVARSNGLQYSEGGNVSVGESIDRLNKTLDGGIYAATLMTGDKGIVRQQKRYNQLMKNKSK